MKLTNIILLITGASAFNVPVKKTLSNSPLSSSFDTEIGAQDPIGFWDPLNLLDDADQERFDRLRYVEVKHGRIAMLAIVGDLVTRSGTHLPGAIDMVSEGYNVGTFWPSRFISVHLCAYVYFVVSHPPLLRFPSQNPTITPFSPLFFFNLPVWPSIQRCW